jgi:hypothetical protein
MVRDFRSDVPPTFERILSQMLATNPDDLFVDANEVVTVLAPFASSTELRRIAEDANGDLVYRFTRPCSDGFGIM